MALQIKNVMKTSLRLANTRTASSSSGVFTSSGFDGQKNQSSKLHLAVQRDYPQAERLPLPPNIDVAETTRFSPLRNRDITSSALDVHHIHNGIDVTLDQIRPEVKTEAIEFNDPHLGSYDRQTSVNLSSIMQSTVPEPFGGNNKFSYLNMPGGSWSQQTKYLSHELNSSHYTQLRQDFRSDWSHYSEEATKGIGMKQKLNRSLLSHKCLFDHPFQTINKRFISLSSENFNSEQAQKTPAGESVPQKETTKSKLQKAVKEYGSTVMVFHVTISLVSLGTSYLLVSSGLDVMAFLEKVNLADKIPKLAENASTFIIAYAIHKVFAPVRVAITLGSTPFIVRFLRQRGFLKK